MAFVRGDHAVNEVKLQNVTGALTLRMADDAAIEAVGSAPGFMSPIGLREGTTIVVDATVMAMYNAVAGANEADVHYVNVTPTRDFQDAAVSVK